MCSSDLVVKVLLEWRMDINATDNLGNTALHYAARFNRANIVQLLLDNNAHIDRKNADGETALDIAWKKGWQRGVTLLMSTANIV